MQHLLNEYLPVKELCSLILEYAEFKGELVSSHPINCKNATVKPFDCESVLLITDNAARIWNVATNLIIELHGFHKKKDNWFALSDGNVVFNAHGTIEIHNVKSNTRSSINTKFNELTTLIALPHSQIAVTSTERRIQIWDTRTMELRHELHEAMMCAGLAPLPRGRLASSHSHGHIHVWDLISGKRESSFWVPDIIFEMISLGERDELAFGMACGSVQVWSVAHKTCVWSVNCCNGWITALSYLPENKLAAAGDTDIVVLDLRDGREVVKLVGHTQRVVGLAACNGGLVSVGHDSTMCIWS